MAIFNSYVSLPEGIHINIPLNHYKIPLNPYKIPLNHYKMLVHQRVNFFLDIPWYPHSHGRNRPSPPLGEQAARSRACTESVKIPWNCLGSHIFWRWHVRLTCIDMYIYIYEYICTYKHIDVHICVYVDIQRVCVYIYIYTLLFLNMFGTSYRYGINPEKPISLSRSVVTAQNGAFVVETAGLYCSISSFTSDVEEKCPSESPAMKLTAN